MATNDNLQTMNKNRNYLVENLSKSTFKDLLDDLLQDKVLSDAERDEILETTPVTKDRARNLVDVVKRKGEQAVSCFLDHLEKRDENLYKNLPEPPKGKSTGERRSFAKDRPKPDNF
ncbi:caspase-1-A isoform X2 [Haplochromis burtoni]|uniref:caspase-1-A isoform X2 n=1 Tax=Haplochromis burtoni TaxID=8153 RepID=UPI001C2D515B|nr:caspase-1-A isoform X2 [Haplochromis burtoni]